MAEHRAACQCGALTVEASAEPDFVVLCNCKACQMRTGAPFGVGAYFQRDALRVAGENRTWGRVAESGRRLENHFCPTCGTNLFWSLEMRPDHLGVALGCFEGPLPAPSRAIWAEEAHDWVVLPDGMPVFPKAVP